MDYDDIFKRLSKGETVSRHEFTTPAAADELVELGWLEVGDDGLLRRGELFELHMEVAKDRLEEDDED